MTTEDNLYLVLDVSPSATDPEIKEAYRRKSMEHHPDKGGDPKIFNLIKQAYDVLSDPHKRNRYDMYANVVRVAPEDVKEHSVGDVKFNIKQGMGTVSIKPIK